MRISKFSKRKTFLKFREMFLDKHLNFIWLGNSCKITVLWEILESKERTHRLCSLLIENISLVYTHGIGSCVSCLQDNVLWVHRQLCRCKFYSCECFAWKILSILEENLNNQKKFLESLKIIVIKNLILRG